MITRTAEELICACLVNHILFSGIGRDVHVSIWHIMFIL